MRVSEKTLSLPSVVTHDSDAAPGIVSVLCTFAYLLYVPLPVCCLARVLQMYVHLPQSLSTSYSMCSAMSKR